MNIRNRIFLIMTLGLAQAGCSQSETMSSNQNPNPQNGNPIEYQDFYQFKLNGCDTGKHVFKSTLKEHVVLQICDALQDDLLNNSCAEPLRQDLFNKKCSGYIWSPKYQPKNTQHAHHYNHENNHDYSNEHNAHSQHAHQNNHENNHDYSNEHNAHSQQAHHNNHENNHDYSNEHNAHSQQAHHNNHENNHDYSNEHNAHSQHENQNTPVNTNKITTEEKILNALNKVLVEKYEIAPSITGKLLESVTKLSEDMMSCGFSESYLNCLDYIIDKNSKRQSKNVFTFKGNSVFYNEYNLVKPGSLKLAFVYKIDQIDPVVKISKVEVYKRLKNIEKPSILNILNDSSNVQLLTTLTLADDFQANAWKRIEKPRDIRELYHLSDILYRTSLNDLMDKRSTYDNYVQKVTKLVQFINLNKSIISASKDSKYQKAIFSFLTGPIATYNSKLIEFCEGLIHSESNYLKQKAALTILNSQPSREDLKPIALEAINSSESEIRAKAISVLSKVQKTKSEENQLTLKINDSDSKVRKAAIDAVSQINVTNENLDAINLLSKETNYLVRLQAVDLLSRVDTPIATKILVGMMDDSDNDVRKNVFTKLNSKNLNDTFVDDLSRQLNSKKWEIRRDAASLLGKINSDSATLKLIDKMDDSESEVRYNIVKILDKKQIKDTYIAPLVQKYQSRSYFVRLDVTKLLGKNTERAATIALINQMNDSEYEVQSKIVSILSKRTLENDTVSALKKYLTSQKGLLRKNAAKLLGKTRSPESLKALQDQLVKETDYDVKIQIKESIKAIK